MSNLTIFGIEEKIKQHKADMAKLEKELEKAKLESLESPDHQLAKELHSMLCTWNHTDGCGWYYEMKNKEDDWTGWAHGEYLKRARKLIHVCGNENIAVERAIEMFKLIRGI